MLQYKFISKTGRFYLLLVLFSVVTFSYGQESKKIQSLKSRLASCENDTTCVSILVDISKEYKSFSSEQMLKYAKQAYLLSLKTGNNKYIGKSAISYANAYYTIRNFDSSLYIINKEKERILNLDSVLVAQLFLLKGKVYRKQYSFNESKGNLLKSTKYAGAKNFETKANAYNALGVLHKQHGFYDSAAAFYIKSQKLYQIIKDSNGLVRNYVNTGKLYFLIDDYSKAKTYYLKALDIVEELDNLNYKCSVYQNLATVYRMSEDYSEALQYYNKALEIAELIDDEIDKGDINNGIGDLYFVQGFYDEALRHFEKSAFIFKNLYYYQGELTAKNNIALVYFEKNNYSTGFAMLDTVLQIAVENDLTDKILMAYSSIATYLYGYGKYKKAYDYRMKWISLNDSIFNLEKAELIADLELKYEKEKNESKILALENKTLQKDLEIKRKISQRNLISGSGIAVVIIFSLLFFFLRQRTRKDRIIHEKEISRLKEEKKALAAQSIVEGQEEERKRVARELHDGLGVLLSNVKMQFSSFMDKSTANEELLSKAANILDQASVDVRRISHNMMPGNLNKFGLVAAIEDLFEEISDSGVIIAEIKTELTDERFSENKEIMLYRIVQELVNNTIKHAGASNISLNMNKFDHKILVNYADNGSGFDPEKVNQKKSMGLKSIEDRVNFLGGELSIETFPGKGTSFGFDFPL